MAASNENLALFKTLILDLLEDRYLNLGFTPQDSEVHLTTLSRMGASSWMCELDYEDCVNKAQTLFQLWMVNNTKIPAEIKDVVYNTAVRTGGVTEWNFLFEQFKTTKIDSDRQKYMAALSATENPSTLLNLLNMTIHREESGIRLQDCIYIYRGISVNTVGREVAMAWLSVSYDEIVDSLGEAGSNAGGGGFARLASTIIDGYANTANTEKDIETINKLVSDHPTDFGGSMAAIEDSLKNAKLNIQWNDLHLENVVKWLKEQYPETETTTPTPETTTPSSAPCFDSLAFMLILGFAIYNLL
jgi:aminopeptidase N